MTQGTCSGVTHLQRRKVHVVKQGAYSDTRCSVVSVSSGSGVGSRGCEDSAVSVGDISGTGGTCGIGGVGGAGRESGTGIAGIVGSVGGMGDFSCLQGFFFLLDCLVTRSPSNSMVP